MIPMSRELSDAASVGVDPERLAILVRRALHEVESGRLPSCQIALARKGRLVAFETAGDAAPDTRYVLQSAGRPVLAAIAWKALGDGLFDLEDRVAKIIPEFATNGKDAVSIRHVLSHTGGFPMAPLGYPRHLERTDRLAAFSKWRLDWEPGSKLAFHVTSSAWVVRELVERTSGMEIRDFLRERITAPLGLSLDLGPPVAEQGNVARYVCTDGREEDVVIDPWGAWYLSQPEVLAAGEPSHTAVSSAADMALLFQALYCSGLWSPEAVAEGTRVQVERPLSGDFGGTGISTRMGLFVLVGAGGGAPAGAPGPTASESTFGHTGAPTQMSFCDPETGISFAFFTNGYPKTGYDRSVGGNNQVSVLGTLAFDCLAR
ncbi:MAG: beta-lactamase family protein [bacterium]|nr:serine hydrolase [Deltaproteobacteria bacterium]MCP4903976.1 beta-lactamase family protein [bacterium]